jgi:hypothetical protein
MVRQFSVGTFLATVTAFKDEIYAIYRMQDWQLYLLSMLVFVLITVFLVAIKDSR